MNVFSGLFYIMNLYNMYVKYGVQIDTLQGVRTKSYDLKDEENR